MIRFFVGILLLAVASYTTIAVAQDDERSRFVRWVERQISTPDMQIRLGRIDGALSSDVRISQITIADRRGVWLTIEGAQLVWSRLALLRGRLSVDSLRAEAIRIDRMPLPAETDEPIESGSEFQLPSLPVAVRVDMFEVAKIEIAEGIIGPAASLAVNGSARLEGGELDARLDINRLDRAGTLQLATRFRNDSRQLAIDLTLSEPAGGVVANALGVQGEPALTFTIAGNGPLDDFTADVSLVADGETLLSGSSQIKSAGADGGLRFLTDVSGNVQPLVSPLYQPLVEGGSALKVDATRSGGGVLEISEGSFKSGAADLAFTATVGADGVPTALSVKGGLEREDGLPIPLPGGGGKDTIGSATIDISMADSAATTFEAEIAVKKLETSLLAAPEATLTATGEALNLHDPASRQVNFTVTGRADGLGSDDAGIANALGSRLALDAAGNWRSGAPATIDNISLETDNFAARFAGTIGDKVSGRYSLDAQSLAVFSALAKRDLEGAINLTADGDVGFDGLFDLTLDATANNLAFDVPQADGLFAGETTIAGKAARTAEGISFEGFKLANPQLSLDVDGALSDALADLRAKLQLVSLSVIDSKLAGALAADLTVSGKPMEPAITAAITSEEIDFGNQKLTNLDTRFDGTLTRPASEDETMDVAGTLSLDARYANEPVAVSARIATDGDTRSLNDLSVRIVDATASGGVTLKGNLVTGELDLKIPELARLAPLMLTEASGTIDAKVTLSHDGERQSARLDGTLQDVEVASATLGYGSMALSADDVFGIPVLDGQADIRALSAGGFTVRTLALKASREGADTTDITLNADLGKGTLDAEGRLQRVDEGFAATLSTFRLAGEGREAVLQNSARVVVGAEAITVQDATLAVDGGTVKVGGSLGENFDFAATIDRLPLSLANLVRPDLGVAGVVNGSVDLKGTREKPSVTANVSASGVTAAMLAERGIAPITLTAAGSFAEGSGSIDSLRASVAGGEITASGTLGDALAITAKVTGMPLALANAFVEDLALAGTVTGDAEITGSLEEPEAAFTIAVRDANAAPLRQAGIGPAQATVAGRYAKEEVSISKAEVQVGGGTLTASGTAGQRLDLKVGLANLPLSIANGFEKSLGAQGTLSGEATVTGRATRPQVRFSLASPSLSTAATRSAGLPAGSLDVRGSVDGTTARLDQAVLRIGRGDVRASGTVGDRLAMRVDITNLPLSIAGSFAPDLGLGGTLSGNVAASGSLARPTATFDIAVANLSATPLAQAGVSGVEVRAAGRFANNVVELRQATARGNGLDVSASGRVPLSGGGLDLRVDANAPLSLANRVLAERGASLDGQLRANARVGGSLNAPSVNGSVTASDITFRDPQANLLLSNGRLDAALAGDRVTIRSMQANLGDGTIAVSGSVGITNGFPADLTVALRDARYADGKLFAFTVNGDLTVGGQLTGTPEVRGRIDVLRAEITVPETFGSSGSLIDVQYLGATPPILETLRRAQVGPFAPKSGGGAGGGGDVVLDVTVDAPARIFVRGRGIDAELGGQLRLTGPVSNVSPVGRFDLIRGRIIILSQRIDFTQGSVTMIGDLDPAINFIGETSANSITARIVVEGQASDPQIRFESTPELPQDEVIAQLIFGRSINDLSAFQLAQLAAAVAELAGGGGGPGLLEQIRVFAGLDNLDIVTDDQGNTSAEAGRYIADNIYLGVRAGARSSGVTVNLDITRKLKVRAAALTDETTLGVFYELEY